MSARRQLAKIVEGLEEQGAKVRTSKNGWVISLPGGHRFTLHRTPSDPRSDLNDRAVVRRAGLRWPLDPA